MYLGLNKELLEKTKKKAEGRSKEAVDGDNYLYGNCEFVIDEMLYEDGTISVCGDILSTDDNNGNLGYLSVDIKVDFDLVIDIIEDYRKKLGKLKTVLEATK